MCKSFAIRKELKNAILNSEVVTIFTVEDKYCGQVTEVGWFWIRLFCENNDIFSSWLIRIDAICSVCAYNRSAKESFYQQLGESNIVTDAHVNPPSNDGDQGSGMSI